MLTDDTTDDVEQTPDLGAAYDRIMGGEPASEGEAAPKPAADRPRAPDGKFAKADSAPAADKVEVEAPAEPVAEPAEVSEAVAPEQAQAPAIEPPQAWSGAAKAQWNSLPPTLQTEISKREADIARGFSQIGQQWAPFEAVLREIEPIKDTLALNGLTAGQYLGQLVAAEKMLGTNPVPAIRWLAQRYGVDLAQLAAGGDAHQPQQPPIDPHLQAAQQRIAALEQRIQSFGQGLTQKDVQADLRAFEGDANNRYSKHPAVRQEMGRLISKGAADTLKAAYDQAIWLVPEIRGEVIAEQAKAKVEATRKASAAKAASAVTVRGSGGASPPAGPSGSLDDVLQRKWDELHTV